MNTAYLLLARFEKPTVHLTDICEEFFGCAKKTAMEKAKAGTLPVPAFRLEDNKRAPWLININDLASLIDRQREQAQREWTGDL
ncbi:MAG: pyocin activator PrtN family protein [Terasakiella sp.]|uniref:pyocin activator PrtN family protein n=1 Tax=unclassified Terasakiella TaxID=2614952 RepID=UPI003AFF6359